MPVARLVLLLAAVSTAAVPAPFAAAGDAPAVTGVEVTSEPRADATYALGETVEVTVRFSEAVDVTGAPGLAIDMDPASWGEKRAAYARGSGTAALVFAHRVVEPNYSPRGIAVLGNTLALNGGTIRSAASGAAAALAHTGLPHNAAHKVDWRLSPRHHAPRRHAAAGAQRGNGARGDGGRGDVGAARGRHLCAGRDRRGDGAVQRGGGCDRRAGARHRHGPGVVGREAGGVCAGLGHGGAGVRARGGGAELLDAGHRGAGGHAGAPRRQHPLGVVGGGGGAGAYGPPPQRGAQGGLAAVAARRRAQQRHAGRYRAAQAAAGRGRRVDDAAHLQRGAGPGRDGGPVHGGPGHGAALVRLPRHRCGDGRGRGGDGGAGRGQSARRGGPAHRQPRDLHPPGRRRRRGAQGPCRQPGGGAGCHALRRRRDVAGERGVAVRGRRPGQRHRAAAGHDAAGAGAGRDRRRDGDALVQRGAGPGGEGGPLPCAGAARGRHDAGVRCRGRRGDRRQPGDGRGGRGQAAGAGGPDGAELCALYRAARPRGPGAQGPCRQPGGDAVGVPWRGARHPECEAGQRHAAGGDGGR